MKGDERKKHILDAALKGFAEHGYERTSIAIICEKAGIARPTLYQYFKDKRSVFRELLENHLHGLHGKIHARQQAADAGKMLSYQETMHSLHKTVLEEFSSNREFYIILLREAKARNAETEDILKNVLQTLIHEFLSEIKSEPGLKAMSEHDLEFTVVYMIGGMLQVAEYYLLDKKQTLSIQELAQKMTFIESRIKGK